MVVSRSANTGLDRRRFVKLFSAMGLSATALPATLWGKLQDGGAVSKEMVVEAARLADLDLSEQQTQMVTDTLSGQLDDFESVRKISLANGVPPAFIFDPRPPGFQLPLQPRRKTGQVRAVLTMPDDLEDLAFASVEQLSHLLRTEQVTSVELTEMYLSRLKYFDEKLHCVITFTEELALEQAERADDEISRGDVCGPLHGIPWGAKDLLHTRGIRTTYGAKPFEHQVVDEDAAVVERLREAGAVLIAKLSLGALAMGDVWFKGVEQRTRNPWNPEQGSSGSSAGSAAATAAGLTGFAIGTETLGSIVSPCSRCGTTGLRPTYGRVSRAGAMALSWTMDKIGAIARSAVDCGLVFGAIHGADPRDRSAVSLDFDWSPGRSIDGIRVGVLRSAFESEDATEQDQNTLAVLEEAGIELVDVELPDLPASSLMCILSCEAATVFDEITRSGKVNELVRQDAGAWPNLFRSAQLVPAVEYLRASRIRSLLIQQMHRVMGDVDVFVVPPFLGGALMITNLTGHPCVVLPNGFRENGTPTSTTFIGRLYGEADLLTVAETFQSLTNFHQRHPRLE